MEVDMANRPRLFNAGKCAACVLVLTLAFSFMGCPIRLIAPYDETVDKQATQLRSQIDQFITGLITAGGDTGDDAARRRNLDYGKFQKDYDKIGVDLRSLEVRADAISQNSETVNQIKLIIKNFELLEKRHKDYSSGALVDGKKVAMGKSYLRNTRDIINEQFKALLSLELTKKQINSVDKTPQE
jgi:hypothetical protein